MTTGQDGAEHLFGEERGILRKLVDEGGGDLSLLLVDPAAPEEVPLGEQGGYPFKMGVVDQFGILGVPLWPVAEKAVELPLDPSTS